MKEFLILGGGPAGLALGWQLAQKGKDFLILEGDATPGGNARTLYHGPFGYDTGAHRLHGRNPEVLADFHALLGTDMLSVSAPSQIFFQGKSIDFPLSPFNLLKNLGPIPLASAGFQWVKSSFRPLPEYPSFEEVSIRKYGSPLARAFLLGYSQKLWGLPPGQLSPAISGQRLKGLDFKTFILEALSGKKAKTSHLDGQFWYPRHGIGQFTQALVTKCGPEKVKTNAKVIGIQQNNDQSWTVRCSTGESYLARYVVSTLPLPAHFSFFPHAPSSIRSLSQSLRFRSLVLLGLVLNRPAFSPNASWYFPDPGIPFTRLYEPKNRSAALGPKNKTLILLEIPLFPEDNSLFFSTEKWMEICLPFLAKFGITRSEVVDSFSTSLPHAYPVLEWGFEKKVIEIVAYLEGMRGFFVAGRNGNFAYSHLQDLLSWAKNWVDTQGWERK